jgi:hypothetical protein
MVLAVDLFNGRFKLLLFALRPFLFHIYHLRELHIEPDKM